MASSRVSFGAIWRPERERFVPKTAPASASASASEREVSAVLSAA